MDREQEIPVSALRRMWNLPSDAEAKAVVAHLAAVGLVELQSRTIVDSNVAVRTEVYKKVLKHELPTGEVNGPTNLLITLSYASVTICFFVNGRNAS